MELLIVVTVLVVLVTPIAAWVAFVRTGHLRADIDALRKEVSRLRRQLRENAEARGTQSAAYSASQERPVRSRTRTDTDPDTAIDGDEDAVPPDSGQEGDAEPPPIILEGLPASPMAPLSFSDFVPEGSSHDGEADGDAPEVDGESWAEEAAETAEDAPAGATADHADAESPADPASEPVPAAAAIDFETQFGTTWILRIGLGVLAIALALFARNIAPQLSPVAKVALAYTGSIALFGFGKFFEPKLERFARPVMAAGLAFGFFVAYAAHFVPGMRAVPLLGSIGWMTVGMATVLIAAERWKSQPTAGLAIFLGHVAAFVSAGEADVYALVLIGFLTATGALLLLRHRWVPLGIVAVLAAYGSHLLWLLADRAPIDGNAGFWLNLAFLTSYYVIFLLADILWWGRRADGEITPEAERGVFGSRQLGPMNLMLYVGLTSFVYFASGARVESIEWYYFTVGALQGSLAWWYRRSNHRDFVFYPAFGTLLWTLGLFAWLDAMVLDLVLAAHALLFLVVAHRTRVWVFHALSQLMLGVAFVHYLVVPTPAAVGWPVLVGGLGLSLVYFVKSGLEEVWYAPDRLEERRLARERERNSERGDGMAPAFSPAWTDAFWRFFTLFAPYLAGVNAFAGAVVVGREAFLYFGPSMGAGVTLIAAQAALLTVVVVTHRPALLFGVTGITLWALALLDRADTTSLAPTWLAGLALMTTALSVAAIRWEDRTGRHATLHAQLQLPIIVVVSVGMLVSTGAGTVGALPWAVLPLLLWGTQEALRPGWARWAPPHPDSGAPQDVAIAVLGGAGVAAVAVFVLLAWLGTGPSGPVGVATTALAVGLLAAGRRSPVLGAGGYATLLGGYYLFFLIHPALTPTLESGWAGVIVGLVPIVVGIGLERSVGDSDTRGIERLPPRAVDTAVYLPYLVGFALLAATSHVQVTFGPSLLIPALAALVFLRSAERLNAQRLPTACLTALAGLHAFFLANATDVPSSSSMLWGVVATGVVTLVAERTVAGSKRADDAPAPGWALPGTVALAAASMMAAVYVSDVFGAQWATAGWSILGGGLMASGFAVRAASHRRVGLIVLGICLVRVFSVDTRGLSDTARIGAFFVLGICLVLVALLYSRNAKRLKEWL